MGTDNHPKSEKKYNKYVSAPSLSFIEKCRHKVSYIIWEQFKQLAKIFGRVITGIIPDSEFSKKEVKTGVIPQADLKELLDCLERAPQISGVANDLVPGFFSNINIAQSEEGYSKNFRFFNLRSESKCIQKVFNNLAPEIMARLGHGFRIANINCWSMTPASAGFAANAWHTDGFPPGMYKLLIYLTPPSEEGGTSEIKFSDGTSTMVVGPAGTWLLFNSTKLIHRGLPALSGERVIINTTIIPAFKNQTSPFFAGQAACFPWFPWVIPFS
jgi:hypothetical protein